MSFLPQQRLAQLRDIFLERTTDEMSVLFDAVKLLQQGDEKAGETIERLAHRIRGTGGTLGFDLISRCAHQIESFAAQLREQHNRDDWPLEQLAASARQLAAELRAAAAIKNAS